jgi:hypothetical protein
MHRLTARLLLVFLLVGTFAPVALAVSAPAPHACCMRKAMHDHEAPQTELRAVDNGHHNCCGPLTVAHWAEPRPPLSARSSAASSTLQTGRRATFRITQLHAALSVRGPPAL